MTNTSVLPENKLLLGGDRPPRFLQEKKENLRLQKALDKYSHLHPPTQIFRPSYGTEVYYVSV